MRQFWRNRPHVVPKTLPNQDGTAPATTAFASITAWTWGGQRPGAGRRSMAKRPDRRHDARPAHEARHPAHVTIRARRELPSLRGAPTFAALCAALAAASNPRFRLIHFSVRTDHLHLIAEASSREALIRGLQGLAGRTARAVNRCLRRHGKVWSGRFHARPLASRGRSATRLSTSCSTSGSTCGPRLRSTRAVPVPGSTVGRTLRNRTPRPAGRCAADLAGRRGMAPCRWPPGSRRIARRTAPLNTSRRPRLVDSCG